LSARPELRTKTFNIDCELEYDVAEQTLFIFNVAVPNTPGQRVRCEAIVPQPSVAVEEFDDAGGVNRLPYALRRVSDGELLDRNVCRIAVRNA
jgi:hypothetical protein